MDVLQTKICKHCPEKGPLPIKRFARQKNKAGEKVYRHTCTVCRRLAIRNKAKRDPILKQKMERIARYQHIKRLYGITLEDYDVMLAAQGGKCKICFGPPTRKHFDIDHCHVTGKVRGLLCSPCNRSIGGFKDNRDSLFRAIEYLQENLNNFDQGAI